MSKKKNNGGNKAASQNTTENYYDLKIDAVERLASADKKTYPKSKEDPGKQYRSGFLNKIPSWVKALFIKFWFNGAVCFFILWGLGIYVTNMLDMIAVLGVVLGIVTDVLVNNAFRFFEVYEGQNSKWMMFPQKKYWTFFANIFYSFVVLFGVIWLYNIINIIANNIKGTEGVILIGVEPILFGLFYMLIDMCFIGMKNTVKSIISDARKKNGL